MDQKLFKEPDFVKGHGGFAFPSPVAPEGTDGRSFVPVVRQPDIPAHDFMTHVFPRGQRLDWAIGTPRHRRVEWKLPGASPETFGIELYDFDTDPPAGEFSLSCWAPSGSR